MTVPSLALPPLLDALVSWQRDQADERLADVRDGLALLCEHLALKGIWLEVDAPPLASLAVGAGTLSDGPGEEPAKMLRGPWKDAPLGKLYIDDADGSQSAAHRAVELALEAVRAESRARRAEQHLEALDEAVRGIGGVHDLERVLQLIVDHVRRLVTAQYAALGIIDEAGDIERFVTSGISTAERTRIGNLPRGHGLLGLIIREGRSFRIPDIGSHPNSYGFPPHHPAMRSFLGAPVLVKGRSVGNLYLTNKRGAVEFSAEDEALVEMFALHAGIAIENARLHEQVQRLAIVDERDRISRELHDSIIQGIYGVTLTLDDVPDLVDEEPDEARQRVDRAIEALHDVTRDIRNYIFGLRPILLEHGGLLEGLRILAGEIARNTAVEVEVRAERPPVLPVETTAELLAIAREALSNVARHAGASKAWIEVVEHPTLLEMMIGDDGLGFDPDATRSGHHGLANMRSRTEALGGVLAVRSTNGRGTRIIVSLPLDGGDSKPGR